MERREEPRGITKKKKQEKRPTVHPLQLFPVPLEFVDGPIDDDDPLAPLVHLRIIVVRGFPSGSRLACGGCEDGRRRFGEGRMG